MQIYSVILGSFILMSFSSARGAIAASILPFILYLFFVFFNKIKIFLLKKRKSDLKALIIITVVILFLIVLGKYYYDFVNTKSIFKMLQRGDITGGRLIIWGLTIEQISNWGSS